MKNKGFTLVELLAVIVVLAIIALIGYSTIGGIIQSVQDSSDQTTIREYAKGVEKAKYTYLASTGKDINSDSSLFPEDWLDKHVKLSKSSVSCNKVSYQKGIHLNGCKVNNGEKTYCYKDNNVYECDATELAYLSRIYGNSIQNGTPSPNDPVDIQSVGDKTKNLLPINDYNGVVSWGTPQLPTIEVEVKPNTSYSFSIEDFERISNIETGNITMYVYGDSSLSIVVDTLTFNLPQSTGLVTEPYVHTINSDEYSKLYFKIRNNAGAETDVKIKNMMLRESSTTSDYEPYGYKIPITVSGKNLYNLDAGLNNFLLKNDDGTYSMWRTSEGRFGKDVVVNIPANTQFTISYELLEYNGTYLFPLQFVATFKDGTTSVMGLMNNSSKRSYTFQKDVVSIKLYQEGTMPVGTYTKFKNLQIELGAEATSYAPYVEPKTYNIYLDEPLRKIGDYSDYIDFEKGQINRYIKKVDLGTMAWHYDDTKFYFYSSALKQRAAGSTNMLCTHYPVKYQGLETGDKYTRGSTSNYIVYLKDLDYTDTTTFQSAMSGKMMYYQLLTPSQENISLPELPKLEGNVTYSVNTEPQPSKIQ